MAVSAPRILIFDSGVGGITVAREIWSLLPAIETIYVCDNGFFPYGLKPEDDLIERVATVVGKAAGHCTPDIVVVACNTASTVALPRLREILTVPVVGVVPAIKPAAAHSRTRVIGLLGTPGTVRRAYTQDLIDRFAADCTVLRVGSADLVQMAEEKYAGVDPDLGRLAAILAPFFDAGRTPPVDTVVLACTHFPLLRSELAEVSPRDTAWIDSGLAVARRVRTLLGDKGAEDIAAREVSRRILFSDPQALSPAMRESFRHEGFAEPEPA